MTIKIQDSTKTKDRTGLSCLQPIVFPTVLYSINLAVLFPPAYSVVMLSICQFCYVSIFQDRGLFCSSSFFACPHDESLNPRRRNCLLLRTALAVPPTQFLDLKLTPAETVSSQLDDTEQLWQLFAWFGGLTFVGGNLGSHVKLSRWRRSLS